jgi:hypothetical protein
MGHGRQEGGRFSGTKGEGRMSSSASWSTRVECFREDRALSGGPVSFGVACLKHGQEAYLRVEIAV